MQAQVKGTVKDNLGDPIAGANLFWQGTTQGTTTSADGTFSLSKPNDKHMLVVSFIGFENDTIHVSNRNETLDIVLREGVELSEVNVVSRKLGTMKLRNSVMNEDMISSAELSHDKPAVTWEIGFENDTIKWTSPTLTPPPVPSKRVNCCVFVGVYAK